MTTSEPPIRRAGRFERERKTGPRQVSIDERATNPLNPRDETARLDELVESMRAMGQLQAVTVIPRATFANIYPAQTGALSQAKWVVIAGNRRLRAARILGLQKIPVHVNFEIDSADKIDQAVLVENIQREGLTPLQEGRLLSNMMSNRGRSSRTVAEMIGKTHTFVLKRVSLLKLIPELVVLVETGKIGFSAASKLAALPDDAQKAVHDAGPPYRVERLVSIVDGQNVVQAAGNPVSRAEEAPPLQVTAVRRRLEEALADPDADLGLAIREAIALLPSDDRPT